MDPPVYDYSSPPEYPSDAKLPLGEDGQSLALQPKSSKRVVPPTTYQLQREGWGKSARIWALSPSSSSSHAHRQSSSLIIDASPKFNPIASIIRSSTPDLKDGQTSGKCSGFHVIDPAVTPPTHCIKRVTWRTFALFEGPGDSSEYSHARKVMDFQTEACFGTTSTYTQTDGDSQHAIMHKVKELNPWWSIQRTLDDFDGVRYSCKTELWTGDITLTRLFDQVVIAKFVRAQLSWTGIGMLHILEPLPQDLLNLILSSIYVKYLCDRERRESSRSGGGGP